MIAKGACAVISCRADLLKKAIFSPVFDHKQQLEPSSRYYIFNLQSGDSLAAIIRQRLVAIFVRVAIYDRFVGGPGEIEKWRRSGVVYL